MQQTPLTYVVPGAYATYSAKTKAKRKWRKFKNYIVDVPATKILDKII